MQLNEVIIHNLMSITEDGMIMLVTELDNLRLLILQNDFDPEVRLFRLQAIYSPGERQF